ncbi:hypothetical protein Bca4012_095309 [Brassica carinata]
MHQLSRSLNFQLLGGIMKTMSISVLPPSLPFKIYYSHPILFASFALICSSPANYPLWFIGKLLYLPISR